MELKTVQTAHVPVRYYEGGQGRPLVFLHGAGGLELDQNLLNSLAAKFHVYAPLLPGYGDSEECAELRDMLDFTLHTWDVVDAIGIKDPILVGFSMGRVRDLDAAFEDFFREIALGGVRNDCYDVLPCPEFLCHL